MDRTIFDIIRIDEVFEILTSVSPDLKKQWNKYFELHYINMHKERLLFFDMMEISAIIVKLKKQKKNQSLELFFEKVELIIQRCDFDVTNLMQAGLIEGIQQICQYENIDMRHDFDAWLKPHTKKVWNELATQFIDA